VAPVMVVMRTCILPPLTCEEGDSNALAWY
jgi:hypothetical protein